MKTADRRSSAAQWALGTLAAAAAAALLGGCAGSEGGFLCTLVPGALSARLQPQPGRFTSDGWLRTDQGFALSLRALRLGINDLTLWGTERGGLRPAPLLSLHPAGLVPVATGPTPGPTASVALPTCTPGCGLSAGSLRAARLSLVHVSAEGEARDETGAGRVPAGTPFSFTLDLLADPRGAVAIEGAIELELGWSTPARLLPDAALSISPGVLDGVDLATDTTGARIRENLLGCALRFELSGVSE